MRQKRTSVHRRFSLSCGNRRAGQGGQGTNTSELGFRIRVPFWVAERSSGLPRGDGNFASGVGAWRRAVAIARRVGVEVRARSNASSRGRVGGGQVRPRAGGAPDGATARVAEVRRRARLGLLLRSRPLATRRTAARRARTHPGLLHLRVLASADAALAHGVRVGGARRPSREEQSMPDPLGSSAWSAALSHPTRGAVLASAHAGASPEEFAKMAWVKNLGCRATQKKSRVVSRQNRGKA
jgi:hypothetical protein